MRMSTHPSKRTSTEADLLNSATTQIRMYGNLQTDKGADPFLHFGAEPADMVDRKLINELSLTWF
jgi:hypothetical protein